MFEHLSTKGQILLLEAEQEATSPLNTFLRERGFTVRVVATPEQALQSLPDPAFDLILLGNSLPARQAQELCHRIRAAGIAPDLPVLVLSDTAEPEAISDLVAAGATDVLGIPFEEHQYSARMKAYLEIASLRSELALRNAWIERETASRRQVEDGVRAAETTGRELIENLSEVIYTAEPDGTLTYVSPGVERLLGYKPAELIGRHLSELIDPATRAPLANRIHRVLAGHREENEYRLLTSTGEIRWAQTSSQPVYSGDQVIGLQGVLTDITERKHAEERIRQQNEFLTTVLESLTHPFYVLNVHDYSIEMANSAARFGSLTGDSTCYALTHRRDIPCDSAEHPCPIEELKRTGKPVTVEHLHHDPEGRERFVEVHSYPLFDEQGNLLRAIEYTLDITERKLAEQALRESKARWRSVTENSPDHVILLDADLKIQFLNYPSPGLTIDELIGTPLYAYVQESSRQEIKEILEGVLETGEPASYETVYTSPGGDTIYYESRVVPRTVEGKTVGLAVNARDNTEHKRAEQALRAASEAAEQARQAEKDRRREAEQRRRVAEGLAGVVAALNSDQTLDHVLDHIAAKALDLLGNQAVAIYRLNQAGDTLALQISHGPVRADPETLDPICTIETLTQALSERRPLYVNTRDTAPPHHQQPGSLQTLLAVPVVVQDQPYGGMVLYSAHDRTFSAEEVELASVFANHIALAVESNRLKREREHAAAAAERNRLARDLHDSVSQALFSATLVAEVLPQVWERDPALAREGLQELESLTRGALAEMRTMLLELRPTALLKSPLQDLVRQVAEAVTGRSGLQGSYQVEPIPTLPPDVHITFYRIAQEALNNVLKHADAQNVTVSLVAAPPLEDPAQGDWQGQITLAISDDGQGFAPGDTKPDQLGLGIMQERADTIGAELRFEGLRGQGTQVTLVWPGTGAQTAE